jgi:putative transposase
MDRFVCHAICQELAGQTVSLKEIEKARTERCKQVRDGLSTRAAMVDRFVAVHHEEPLEPMTQVAKPVPTEARPRLKRYINE